MKLAVLVDGFEGAGGGVATYVESLPDVLAPTGVDVVFFSGLELPATVTGVHVPGLQLDGPRLGDATRAALERAIAEVQPDAFYVHVICPEATTFAATHGPVVVYAHEYLTVCPGGARHLERRRRFCHEGPGARCIWRAHTDRCNNRHPRRQQAALRRVSGWKDAWPSVARVLVASEAVRDVLARDGAPRTQIDVLPYPIAPRAATASEPSDVLYLGRLTRAKGVDVLLHALARIDAQATIAGDGPARGELEQLAEELEIAGRTRFTGWVEPARASALVTGARVLALPSLWREPFGMVGVEALAAGIPVIASAVGGIPSWLPDDTAGLLVSPGNAAELAAALGSVLHDDALHARLAAAGPAAAARFTPTQHGVALTELFRQLLADRNSSAACA